MLLVFFVHHLAAGQLPRLQLQAIPGQQGLKTADILFISKDRDGFLWLAAQSHVQRFDGAHAKLFSFEETVDQVLCDRNNRKWVLARGKIYLLINHVEGFQEKPCKGPAGKSFIALFEKQNGEVGLLRSDGFYAWKEETQQFEREKEDPKLSGKVYRNLFVNSSSGIYFSSTDSVYYRKNNETPIALISASFVRNILPISADELLVSTSKFETYHLQLTNAKSTKIIKPINCPAPNRVVLFDGEQINTHEWLLATIDGLFIYNSLQKTISQPSIYANGRFLLNQPTITHFFRDEGGTIFMNHIDGLYALNAGSSPLFYIRDYEVENERMPGNEIRNFAEDPAGHIWMASTKGIAVLNMQNGALKSYTPTTKNHPISFPSMRQLLADGPLIWIGTSGQGIWKYDTRNHKFSNVIIALKPHEKAAMEGLQKAYIWKLLKLPDAKLFIASGSGSYLLDVKNNSIRKLKLTGDSGISRTAIRDSSGRIWHGTTRGFICLNDSFETLFAVRDSLVDKRVAGFCEWRANRMLIGSKGLYEAEVKGGKLISFRKKKGFPAVRFIYCLKQDKQGFVWIGTDEGLYRYDPVSDSSVPFGLADQVQTQAFSSDGLFMDKNGWMFAGGKSGFNYFKPELVKPLNTVLKPDLLSFTFGTNDSGFYENKLNLKLPYNQRDIRFAISAPNFTHPFQIQYRYKLEGYSNQWFYNGSNYEASISNLPAGNYLLTVSAGFNNYYWNAKAPLNFTVLKPWWQTLWFRLLCLFLLAVCVGAVIYRRKLNRKNQEIKNTIDYFALSGAGHASAEEIVWDIARNCISRLGFEDCVIYLLDEERKVLVQKAAFGAKSSGDFEIINPIEISLNEGITGYVAFSGKPLLVPDTSKEPRYLVDDKPRASELAIPILHEGKTIGVLDSEHSTKGFFTKKHLQTLQTIVSLCSAKLSAALAREAMRKATEEMNHLQARMLESKFMNLRLQMNPHFLFNTLSSIQYLVVSNQTNKANKYLSIFSGYLRAMLQHAETTMVSLEEEMRMLKLYIELESLVLDESFSWQMVIDEEVDAEEIWIPCMLLQPFVENAIHHGLMNKLGEKRFGIQIINHNDAYFTCQIADNGIGRKAAENLKAGPLATTLHNSRALAIVTDRLNLIGEKTGQTASVQIEDLYNEQGPAGTKIILQIPYYHTNLL